jgi:hypothetical protein
MVQEKSEGKKKKKTIPIPEALRKIKAGAPKWGTETPKWGTISR